MGHFPLHGEHRKANPVTVELGSSCVSRSAPYRLLTFLPKMYRLSAVHAAWQTDDKRWWLENSRSCIQTQPVKNSVK